MFLFNNLILLAPEETPNSSGPKEEMSIEKMVDFLGKDDENKEDKEEVLDLEDDKEDKEDKKGKKEDKEEKEDEDDDEITESEDEDEDEEDEDDKEIDLEDEDIDETLIAPVRRKEILAKYPKLFKEFPYLEVAYQRDRQFTEIFSHPKEAAEALNKGRTLDVLYEDLKEGKIEKILKAVKNYNEESFNKVVDDYVVTLKNVDDNAFQHVLKNWTKDIILSMLDESKGLEEDDAKALRMAAQILNQFMFSTKKFEPKTKLSKGETTKREDDPREKQLREREEAINRKAFEESKDSVNTKIDNVLKATIAANIDKNGQMPPIVKEVASERALQKLNSVIANDKIFRGHLDRLWEFAFRNNYSKPSMDRIRSAYLSKAKQLLPTVIQKARSKALEGMKMNSVDSDKESKTDKVRKGPPALGRSTSSSNSGKSDREKARAIPKEISSRDFLLRD